MCGIAIFQSVCLIEPTFVSLVRIDREMDSVSNVGLTLCFGDGRSSGRHKILLCEKIPSKGAYK